MKHYIINVPDALTPARFNALSVAEKKLLSNAFKHAAEVSEIESEGVEIMLGREEHKRLIAAGVQLFATVKKG